MQTLLSGLGGADFALTLIRIAAGMFFVLSGYHKLTNAGRHASLVETLRACHVPCIRVMQWFVPGVEFFAGLGLAFGFLAPLSAAGLLAICIVATCTDGLKRIKGWGPIDKADYIDDVLYLPEVIYMLILIYFLGAGAGAYSLDNFLF